MMGSDRNETGGRKPKKVEPNPTSVDFWSWHPTEAQKRQFEGWMDNQAGLDDLLDQITRLGIVLTVTRGKTNDSVCVVARNRFDSYGKGQALSVFHTSAERALYGMAFVLSVLHPQWPSEPVRTVQRAIDW